jgi:AcrR family transcriptional regulator
MARLKKEDWLSKGLHVLSTKGYNNLRLEYLCEQLEVTRGSFYHHFEDINDYVDKLMAFWESDLNQIMQDVEKQPDGPLERLNVLQKEVFRVSARLEVVIRAWASFNKTVLKYMRRIDRNRTSMIARLYEESGMDAETASKVAQLEYAHYIGVQNLYFTESRKETESLFYLFERILIKFGKHNVKDLLD